MVRWWVGLCCKEGVAWRLIASCILSLSLRDLGLEVIALVEVVSRGHLSMRNLGVPGSVENFGGLMLIVLGSLMNVARWCHG